MVRLGPTNPKGTITPKNSKRVITETHKKMNAETIANGENNDCAIRAIALATGTEYRTVKAKLAEAGRKPRRGTYSHQSFAVLGDLGFKATLVNPRTFIDRYPGIHATHKNVTTHHPARFNKVWKDGKTYLMQVKGHILCVKDGENQDWSAANNMRATAIWEIKRKRN